MDQRHQLGRAGQLGHQVGADQPVRAPQRRPARRRCRPRWPARRSHGSPPGRPAAARRPHTRARPQRHPSRSAPAASAPNASARRCTAVRGSCGTHGARQRVQPRVEGVGIGAKQAALDAGPCLAHRCRRSTPPDRCGAPGGAGAPRRHPRAATILSTWAPNRPCVSDGQRATLAANCASTVSEHVGVIDQIGAINDGGEHPIIDVPGGKHLPHLGQPLTQRPRVAQPASGQPLRDPQVGAHLRRHRRHRVDRPILGVRTPRQPIGEQLPDRAPTAAAAARFSARAAAPSPTPAAPPTPPSPTDDCRSTSSSNRARTSSNIRSIMPPGCDTDITVGRKPANRRDLWPSSAGMRGCHPGVASEVRKEQGGRP